MKILKLLGFIAIYLIGIQAIFGQGQVVFDATSDNQTFTTCDPNTGETTGIVASGGSSNPVYGNNEDITVTFCPFAPGDAITATFAIFNLSTIDTQPGNGNNADQMYIYDGPNTSAPSLGNYGGTTIQGTNISATITNTTGCLTFQFVSNDQGTGTFSGSVACSSPCDVPLAAGILLNGENGATDFIKVCIGEEVQFQETDSDAAIGYNLISYNWDFMDGTIANGTDNGIVSHSWSQPGQYFVQLFVQDDNMDNVCTNTNFISLEVLVAPQPEFVNFQEDVEICVGESITFTAQPDIYEVTWNGFNGVTEVETGCFTDDQLGVAQDVEIYQSGFLSGTIIQDTSDILDICFEMEHSFIGDIVVILTCPNGQSMTLHQQGGGGLNLGEPNPATNMDEFPCNDPATTGVPYQYCFGPGQNQTWVEYANSGGGGQVLPAGTYQPIQPFSNLVGCPANGIWTLTIVDNWAVDDGQIFSFDLNLNPNFYPPVTEFTPEINIDANYSYWNQGSLPAYASINDINADEISIVPTQAGIDVFTYTVVDDFGCSNSTSFTVTTFEALQVTAGSDFELGCGSTQLQGGIAGMPSCTDCMNNYNIPYQPGTFLTETYCPDASDGTMMAITVSGSVETCCDLFQIYNGTDVNATVLFSWGQGTGLPATLNPSQQFVSTDPSGCITFSINPDMSVQPVITITVTAFTPDGLEISGGPIYDFIWTPSTGLSDNTTLNPEVVNIDETTTFTLVGFPTGHPACASTDEVMVSIMPGMNPGLDATTTLCANASNVLLTDLLGGNPVSTGVWTDPNGSILPNGILTGTNNAFGNYTYTVSWGNGCFLDANLLLLSPESPILSLTTTDSTMCPNEVIVFTNVVTGGTPTYNYSWTFNNLNIGTNQNLTNYAPASDGIICLEVTDECGMTSLRCVNVTYNETFPITAIANSTCWPESITLENTTSTSNYTNATWSVNGTNIPNSGSILEYTPLNAGPIDLTLTLSNANGCVYDSTFTAIATSYAPPLPTINFTQNNLIYSFNSENNYLSYDWAAIGEDTSMFGSLPLFEVDFPQGENVPYDIALGVLDENGCYGQSFTNIVVTGYNASGIGCPEGIENCTYGSIPNIVSPNGDGKNDYFWVPNKNLQSLDVLIFNRWGNQVGSINTPNKTEMIPAQTWNAKDYSAGTYYYTIYAEGKDGQKHQAKGEFLVDK